MIEESGRMDMSGKEYFEFQRMAALVDELENRTSRLEARARASAPGTWRDLCLLRKLARKVYDALAATLPEKRKRLINAELTRTVCRIEVLPPMNLPHTKHTEYATVPTEDLDWVVNAVLKWECALCGKEGQEAQTCPFRRHLDALFPFAIRAKGECHWQTVSEMGDGEQLDLD